MTEASSQDPQLDALGLDKHRHVVGGRYRASVARRLITYAIAVVLVIGAALGLKLLTDELDQPPTKVEKRAPWAGTDREPTPLQ